MDKEIILLEKIAKDRGITVEKRPYVGSESSDIEELTGIEFPSVTPEHREEVRLKILKWESDTRIPSPLQEFVNEVSKICEERGLRCNFEQFRCDDIRDLFEYSSSFEYDSDSEDDPASNDLWRSEVSLSKDGKVFATGTITHLSFPSISLICDPPIESKKHYHLSSRNLFEVLDNF